MRDVWLRGSEARGQAPAGGAGQRALEFQGLPYGAGSTSQLHGSPAEGTLSEIWGNGPNSLHQAVAPIPGQQLGHE